jgi:hypothetical protein
MIFLAGWVLTWREESLVAQVAAGCCGGWPIAGRLSLEFASGSFLNADLLSSNGQ